MSNINNDDISKESNTSDTTTEVTKSPTTEETSSSKSTITAAPQINKANTSPGNNVFLYNGVWAYKSETENDQLYLFDQTKNQWVKSTDIVQNTQTTTASNKQEKQDKPQQKNKRNNNKNNFSNKKGKKNNRENNDINKEKKEDVPVEIVDLVVSNIPTDPRMLSMSDLYHYFRKAGFIQETLEGVPRVKFFLNEDGGRTGQAVISFARKESIQLAIQLYDETEIVPGYVIKLAQAEGDQIQSNSSSGGGSSSSSKYKKSDKREDMKNKQNYGWEESESRVVVLKNLFDPMDSWTNPNFFDELKEDIESGCERCGEIQTVSIFERNPEGVAIVKFKDYESAEACVALMEGRYFDKRQLSAELYDGFTDYHVEETEEEKELRMKVWEKYLLEQDQKDLENERLEREQQQQQQKSIISNDEDADE